MRMYRVKNYAFLPEEIASVRETETCVELTLSSGKQFYLSLEDTSFDAILKVIEASRNTRFPGKE